MCVCVCVGILTCRWHTSGWKGSLRGTREKTKRLVVFFVVSFRLFFFVFFFCSFILFRFFVKFWRWVRSVASTHTSHTYTHTALGQDHWVSFCWLRSASRCRLVSALSCGRFHSRRRCPQLMVLVVVATFFRNFFFVYNPFTV